MKLSAMYSLLSHNQHLLFFDPVEHQYVLLLLLQVAERS